MIIMNAGMVAAGYDFTPGSAHLAALEKDLQDARSALAMSGMTLTPVPVGVGFVTCHDSVTKFREIVLPILEKYSMYYHW